MTEKGGFDSVPETGQSTSVPEGITGRGRERFFHLLKEGLVASLLLGAGMFGVLIATGGGIIPNGSFELSAAVGMMGGAAWVIEPVVDRLPRRLVEYLRQR